MTRNTKKTCSFCEEKERNISSICPCYLSSVCPSRPRAGAHTAMHYHRRPEGPLHLLKLYMSPYQTTMGYNQVFSANTTLFLLLGKEIFV